MVIFHDNFTNRNGDLTGCLEVSGWQILVAHHFMAIARWCPRSLAKLDFNYRYYRLTKQRGNEFLLYIDLQVPRK